MGPGDNSNAGESRQDQGAGERGGQLPEQTIFPSPQELRDLPQLLPEETRAHLQNAGREALLALYSLWQSIGQARSGNAANKVRKRIDVE